MDCPVCQAGNSEGGSACRVCGSSLELSQAEAALPPGTILRDSRYIIERRLGQGGFGITYLANDARLRRQVAVKEFFPATCRREGFSVEAAPALAQPEFVQARENFLEEAATLQRFDHDGIVRVHDCFEENGTAYMAMEYLRGQSLSRLLESNGGRLDEAKAVAITEQTTRGLEAMHHEAMLHRDVKPDNIMICEGRGAVLIDFGSARDIIGSQAKGHTVMVTPGYAPLEQYARHAQRGAYTDVYALAATLYHLVTGVLPPSAADRAAGVELDSPRELCPDLSPQVEQAIMAAMEMKIGDRPQTVRQFRSMLRRPAPTPDRALHRNYNEPASKWQPGDAAAITPSPPLPPLRTSQRLPYGYFEVALTRPREVWPVLCVCCGQPSTSLATVPGWDSSPCAKALYCEDCRNHIAAERMSGLLAGLSVFIILFLTVGVVCGLSLADSDQKRLVAALVVPLVTIATALALGRRKVHNKKIQTSKCKLRGNAVLHYPQGAYDKVPIFGDRWGAFHVLPSTIHVFGFRNRTVAEAFQQANAGKLATPTGKSGSPWGFP